MWKDICGFCYIKKKESEIEDLVHDAIPKYIVPDSNTKFRIRPPSIDNYESEEVIEEENEGFTLNGDDFLQEREKTHEECLEECRNEIRELKKRGEFPIVKPVPKRSSRKADFSWADASMDE